MDRRGILRCKAEFLQMEYHQSAVPKTLQGIHPELDPFRLSLSSVCQIKNKQVQQAEEMSKKT